MNENTTIDDGWCCYWATRNCPLFAPCVRLDGVMLCIPCAAREVGLVGEVTAAEVIAAAEKRAKAA